VVKPFISIQIFACRKEGGKRKRITRSSTKGKEWAQFYFNTVIGVEEEGRNKRKDNFSLFFPKGGGKGKGVGLFLLILDDAREKKKEKGKGRRIFLLIDWGGKGP